MTTILPDVRRGVEPVLEPGSPLLECLQHIYAGEPAVLVKSPPGAGKSTLIARLCNYLVKVGGESVHVSAPTHRASRELAVKLVGELGYDRVVVRTQPGVTEPQGSINEQDLVNYPHFHSKQSPFVLVSTVASLEMGMRDSNGSIVIIDEAYQVKYRQLAVAADAFDHLVMVGDPGQIGPVDTGEATALFRGSKFGPNRRGPEAIEALGAKVVHLPHTFRVGQETVNVIAPLYGFPFSSRRVNRYVEGLDEIEALEIGAEPSVSDVVAEAVGCVSDFMSRSVTTVERDGATHTRAMTEGDIAVVASRNLMVASIRGGLDDAGLSGVVVDTADRLQGGQWHAVLAVDPVIQSKKVSEHALSTGRLCVMVSRHMSHLTWLYAENWLEVIKGYEKSNTGDVSTSIVVRRRLTEGCHD